MALPDISPRGSRPYPAVVASAAFSIGVLSLQDVPWPVLVERARRAESLGFDVFWVADHFVNPYAPRAHWYEGWTVLAGLAAATERIRIGTLVTSNTLRNPVLLARMAMTVDHISGGRLELGIGPGGAPLDYSMLGLPTWSPGERVDRLDETLRVLIPLLETGEAHHDGRYHRIDEAIVAPRPIQQPRPPITIGALGPRAIELAARHGDAWNTYGVAEGRSAAGHLSHPDALVATARRVALLDAACDRLGRDRASIRRSYLSFRGILEPIGKPAEFAAMVDDFRSLGFTQLSLYWPSSADEEAVLEAVGREVLPSLR